MSFPAPPSPPCLILSQKNRRPLPPSHPTPNLNKPTFVLLEIEVLLVWIYAKEDCIKVWESHRNTIQHSCFSIHLSS